MTNRTKCALEAIKSSNAQPFETKERRRKLREHNLPLDARSLYPRAWYLKYHYGLTLTQFNSLLEAQGGVCAICGKINTCGIRLFVDHCHKTNKVRGLLCRKCNILLGHFRDQPEAILNEIKLLHNTVGYLQKHVQ